jgi:hypothetical protein
VHIAVPDAGEKALVGSRREGQDAGRDCATRVAGIVVGCTEPWEAPPESEERVQGRQVGTWRNFAAAAVVVVVAAVAVRLGDTPWGWHTATSELGERQDVTVRDTCIKQDITNLCGEKETTLYPDPEPLKLKSATLHPKP